MAILVFHDGLVEAFGAPFPPRAMTALARPIVVAVGTAFLGGRRHPAQYPQKVSAIAFIVGDREVSRLGAPISDDTKGGRPPLLLDQAAVRGQLHDVGPMRTGRDAPGLELHWDVLGTAQKDQVGATDDPEPLAAQLRRVGDPLLTIEICDTISTEVGMVRVCIVDRVLRSI